MPLESRRSEPVLYVGIMLVAMAAVAIFSMLLPAEYRANQSTDFLRYYEPVAQSILAGNGIREGGGELATRYPPGFSLLLAAVWGVGREVGVPDDIALDALRLLCAGCSAALLYALARTVWPLRGALLVVACWVSYPFFLWIYKQPNSEVPFIPVMLAAILVFWRAIAKQPGSSWSYLLAGGLCGAAMLIRPAAIGMGVVLAGIALASNGASAAARVRRGAWILLGNLIVVAPWVVPATAAHGRFVPLSTGDVGSVRDGLTFLVNPKDYRLDASPPPDIRRMMETFERRESEITSTGAALRVMREVAADAPVTFARLMLLKAARSWYGTDSLVLERPAKLVQAAYLLVCLVAFVAMWRSGGTAWRLAASAGVVVLYFWAVTITVLPLLRYMVPSMALLFIALPALGRIRPRPIASADAPIA